VSIDGVGRMLDPRVVRWLALATSALVGCTAAPPEVLEAPAISVHPPSTHTSATARTRPDEQPVSEKPAVAPEKPSEEPFVPPGCVDDCEEPRTVSELLDAWDAASRTPGVLDIARVDEKRPARVNGVLLEATGELRNEDLLRSILVAKRRIRGCYVDAVATDTALRGQIEVSFVVDAEGAVSQLQTQSSVDIDRLEPCVTESFEPLRFPKPGPRIVRVRYRLVFSPADR
jgi:hypothetical protein